MKIQRTEVNGFYNALYGMRLPWNSHKKSDSKGHLLYKIGDADMKLAKSLAKAGTEHGKFLRMINVSCLIQAPLYWWKQLETYKVGTVSNSESTMHTLCKNQITQKNFEYMIPDELLEELEQLRMDYNDTGDKECWATLVNILPCGWLQKRVWSANYAVLQNIYRQRKNHKLPEWRQFCTWIESLPYSELITLKGEE